MEIDRSHPFHHQRARALHACIKQEAAVILGTDPHRIVQADLRHRKLRSNSDFLRRRLRVALGNRHPVGLEVDEVEGFLQMGFGLLIAPGVETEPEFGAFGDFQQTDVLRGMDHARGD